MEGVSTNNPFNGGYRPFRQLFLMPRLWAANKAVNYGVRVLVIPLNYAEVIDAPREGPSITGSRNVERLELAI